MGIQDLQNFIETQVPDASVPVDILRIARALTVQRRPPARAKGPYPPNKLCLVVDGECCLDRLYGGYFSDWACGGQWNRMVQFLAVLVQTVQTSNIELAVFFNGSLEQQRMSEWNRAQQSVRLNVNQVLKHINTKGTPPPKVWWVPPVCLRTCLRMALRHLNVTVVCTMDDHHQEVIAYCRENNFQGLMAEDSEYAVFDPPRYFSSEQLKLTYKGSLETKEYILDHVARSLDLNPNRFCVMAALLGNYLLTEADLADFHKTLCPDQQQPQLVPPETLIRAVAKFVRSLQSIENLDAVATQVFGSGTDRRASKFKQCVQYYLNGTKDGFLRYRPPTNVKRSDAGHYTSSKPQPNTKAKHDASKFASETIESERDSLQAYREATAGAKIAPQIVIEPPLQNEHGQPIAPSGNNEENGTKGSGTSPQHAMNGGPSLLLSSSSSSSSSSAASPSRLTPDALGNLAKSGDDSPSLPQIPPEVLRTASERHQKGLMSPHIYQILTQGEIKMPVIMEDEMNRDLPSIHLFYRPVRQMVYAILFNLHHFNYLATKDSKESNNKEMKDKSASEAVKAEIPDIRIKEWVWTKSNPYKQADIVKAELVGWGVPTVQRLWFGSAIDDKRRRLRAFLTCMRSDTPLMLNPSYVPQHLLVMACVLRYIMSFPEKRILRKPELDAFIAQAFSPELMNAHFLQELQLPVVSSRGVQLAALFMQGVETALMANDACGAPIPWLMCCPWLFFDGKLFHHKMAKAATCKNLLELCDHHIEQVVKVERMRKAILEGLDPQFARPPLPQMPGKMPDCPDMPQSWSGIRIPGMPPNMIPAGAQLMPPGGGRGRGLVGRRAMLARGGQLEIAGVVVGSWGPNYGSMPRSRGLNVPPQITSVGGVKPVRSMMGNYGPPPFPSRPTFPTRGAKVTRGRRIANNTMSFNRRKMVPPPPAPVTKKINNSVKPPEDRGRGLTLENSVKPIVNGSGDGKISVPPTTGQFEDADGNAAAAAAAAKSNGQGDDASLPTAVNQVAAASAQK